MTGGLRKKAPFHPQAVYFGKLPTRGDFVRSAGSAGLVDRLDTWMSRAIELMCEDSRWRLIYDAAPPLHFAILGPAHGRGLAGHMRVSRDASGRRFPFVRAASFEVPDPLDALRHFPLALAPLWQAQAQEVQALCQAEAFSEGLLGNAPAAPVLTATAPWRAPCEEASASCTLAQLTQWLGTPEAGVDVRQAMLALGLLLQPVGSQGCAGLGKGLALPLPRDPAQRPQTMAFWSRLIAPFFRSTRVELAFLVGADGEESTLLVDFHGVSPVSLRAALDPAFALQQTISVASAEWVEAWVGSGELGKLSTLLRDPDLSWACATRLFHDVFLGESNKRCKR